MEVLNSSQARNGGKAARFGGVSSPASIRIPNRDSLVFGNAATIDMWVRLDSMTGMNGWGSTVTDGTYAMTLVAKSHDREGAAFMVSSNGGMWAATYDGTWNDNSCTTYIANPNIPIGTWFRTTYVVSTTGGIKYYVNKQLAYECNNARPSFTTVNSQDLYIGKFRDEWFPLDGAVQDIAIYKSALSGDQIQALQ